MQQIRIDQLNRIKVKADILCCSGVIDDTSKTLVEGVCDISVASEVPKYIRDRNWDKIDLIEKTFDLQLRALKQSLMGQDEEKIQIIDNLLGEGDSEDLMNTEPIGRA